MSDVKEVYNTFTKEHDIQSVPYGGIYELNHDELRKQQKAAFDVFSQSRYSCRDFSDEPINRQALENALRLCERTPTYQPRILRYSRLLLAHSIGSSS